MSPALPTLRKQYPETPFTFKRAVLLTDWKEYQESGRKYRIRAELRFDDQCGNGHRTFSLTGEVQRAGGGAWEEDSGGMIHDEIAKRFPGLAPFTRWHLTSTDGPLHYVANTVYLAGDRDYDGLRKGEVRQIRNRRTGLPCWHYVTRDADGKEVYGVPPVDSMTMPLSHTSAWEPLNRVGEGKARQLDAAREAAVWPDATDEQLMAEPAVLTAALQARLPALLADFRTAMESLGFPWELAQEGGAK